MNQDHSKHSGQQNSKYTNQSESNSNKGQAQRNGGQSQQGKPREQGGRTDDGKANQYNAQGKPEGGRVQRPSGRSANADKQPIGEPANPRENEARFTEDEDLVEARPGGDRASTPQSRTDRKPQTH